MKSRVKNVERKLKTNKLPICVRWRFIDEEGEWNNGAQKCVLKRYREVAVEECDRCQADVRAIEITWYMDRPGSDEKVKE